MNCKCCHFPNLSIERYETLKLTQNKKITKADSNTQTKKKAATDERVNGPRAFTRCNTKCCNNNHFVNISRIRAIRQHKSGTSDGSVLPLKKVKTDGPSEKKKKKISTRGKMKATKQSHLSASLGHDGKKSSMFLPDEQLTGRSNVEEGNRNGGSEVGSEAGSGVGSSVGSEVGSSVEREIGHAIGSSVGSESRSGPNARIMKNATHQKYTENDNINAMEKNKSKSCSLRNIMGSNSALNKDILEDTSIWGQLCENAKGDPNVYTPSNELLEEQNIWECAKGKKKKKKNMNIANVYTVCQNDPSLSIEERCPLVGINNDVLLGGDETEDPLKMNGTAYGEMLLSKKSYLIAGLANMPRGGNKDVPAGGKSGLSIGRSSDRSSGGGSEHCSGGSSEHGSGRSSDGNSKLSSDRSSKLSSYRSNNRSSVTQHADGSAQDRQMAQGSPPKGNQSKDRTHIADDIPLVPVGPEECKKPKSMKDEEYAKKNHQENISMYNLIRDICKGSKGVKNNEGGVLLNLENLASREQVKKNTSSRKAINQGKEKMSSIFRTSEGKKQDPTCAGGRIDCNNKIGLPSGDAGEGHSEKGSAEGAIEQTGENESEPRYDPQDDPQDEPLNEPLNDPREDQIEQLRNQLNQHLYKKLTDDTITESTNNTCSDFNESTHNNSSPKSTKFLLSMCNEEERDLCEKITLPKSTTNSVVNSMSVYMDSSSSMSDGSLYNDINRKKSNVNEFEKKENASCNLQKKREYPNVTPLKGVPLINHTVHDKSSGVRGRGAVPSSSFPIQGKIINLVGTNQVQHADEENKKDIIEEGNKIANLKRSINRDVDYSLKKKLKIEDYSLLNLNIYKNNPPELYKNNSYNTYILKSLQNSYLRNKLFNGTYNQISGSGKKKGAEVPPYVENTPPSSTEKCKHNYKHKHNSKRGSADEYDEAEGWDFIRLTNNEMDERVHAEETTKRKRQQRSDMNSYYDGGLLNGMECPQSTQLINVDTPACRSSPFKEQNFSATYKGGEATDDHFNSIYTNDANYSNLLKEKQLDNVHLNLRDIISLLEKERIGNLYSEEELESIIIPVGGVYYDSGRMKWSCRYEDGDKMTNMRRKFLPAQSFSYHQSRQMALQHMYNYIRKKYNIFSNLDDEERMFFVSISGYATGGRAPNGGAPNGGKTNQRGGAHQGKNPLEKLFNEYCHDAGTAYGCTANEPGQRRTERSSQKPNPKELQPEGEEGEEGEEVEEVEDAEEEENAEDTNRYHNGADEKRRPFYSINKSPTDVREANLNNTINPLSVEIPPSASASSSHEGSHTNCAVSGRGKVDVPSYNIVNAKKDAHNWVGEISKSKIKEKSFQDGDHNLSTFTQSGDTHGEYPPHSSITSKTRAVLYKTLGVEFSNDLVDKMQNLPKENIFYERDKKRWVIKIFEKKTNTLLYFKEFDCTVFGFVYACILTIEHKHLYLDYFLNEKNYDFLMQLIQNSSLKRKLYFNSAVRSTGLGSSGSLAGANTFFMEGVNEEASALAGADAGAELNDDAGAELNDDADRQRIKSRHNPNFAFLVDNPDAVWSDKGLSRFGEFYQTEKFGRENLTMYNRGASLSKPAHVGHIFAHKYPSKNDLQATRNDAADRRKTIPSCLQKKVDGEYFTNAVGTNICGGNVECSRGKEKEMNWLQMEWPQKEWPQKEWPRKEWQQTEWQQKGGPQTEWQQTEQLKRTPKKEHHITERGKKNKTREEESHHSFVAQMEKMQHYLPHDEDNNKTMVISNVRSDFPNEVASCNGNTDTLSPHSAFQNSEICKDQVAIANETDDKNRKKTRQTNQMKAKKDSLYYKKTKNSKDAVANGKDPTLTADLMQEETNNLLKLDSYIESLENNTDVISLAKETILLLLKDIINCIPFQMAPSVISRKIYYQKINAHVKFVYHSQNILDLMPYFFIFKNVIKQKKLPSDQSLYICNVLLYALFEA
ncbi:ACDC domain-containing protein, putative [Plasmodium vivax]|nr:ACDC domain-containing protein, putative [Plasmodium vivax]